MNAKLQKLKEWGCDIEGAMARVLDDEDFLLECIHDVAYDPAFDTLNVALKTGSAEQSFELAHALKGIIANTGLTPLFKTIVQIVEPLRAGNKAGTAEAYAELRREQEYVQAILEDNA